LGAETHLVVTPAGVLNLHHELGLERREIEALADHSYAPATSAPAWPAAASTRRRW
jgi:flavin prenyltransferase